MVFVLEIDRKRKLIPPKRQKHIILGNTILPVLTGIAGRPNESEVIIEIQVLNLQTREIRCQQYTGISCGKSKAASSFEHGIYFCAL